MVQDGFQQVPHAEADQEGGGHSAAGARCGERITRATEEPKSDDPDHIHHRMEQTVGQYANAQVLEDGVIEGVQEAVPLQDLVQQDAVEEATRAA